MNQPDRYSRFVLPEGVEKVDYQGDTKIKNAGTFVIRLEDHTLGNLLRQQLHSDAAVVFAGYRIPHPLDPVMHVRIQTTDAKNPVAAMSEAIQDLRSEVEELQGCLLAEGMHPSYPIGQPRQPGGGAGQQQLPPGGLAPMDGMGPGMDAGPAGTAAYGGPGGYGMPPGPGASGYGPPPY